MIRTSTCRHSSPPTGRSTPSSTMRSSFSWTASGAFPTSSRNSVPPSARANAPRRSRAPHAPVPAPEASAPERRAHLHGDGQEPAAVLRDVVARAELHRLDGDLLGAPAGDHDDGQLRTDADDLTQAVEAVAVPETIVE